MQNLKYLIIVLLCIFLLSSLVYPKTDPSGIPLESNPRGIAINPLTDIAIATNEMSQSVSIVDLNTQEVIETISVGKFPKGVAIDKTLNIALITNSHDDTVSVIDLNTYQVIETIPVGKYPQGIAIDSLTHKAIIANHKDNSVSVIDLQTYDVIGIISVGHEPIDISVDPEHEVALVLNEKDYNVSVIDLNTYQVRGTIPVGKKPQAIDINPESHLAVVTNEKDNSITVINLVNEQTVTIPIGKHPIDVAINPLDNRALVICDEDRSLLLIDLNTNIIIKNYSLNKLPKGVVVNPYTNIAGVVDDKTDSLTLIQLPNPVPEIESIIPDTLLRGGKTAKITLEGSKFIKTSSAFLKLPTEDFQLTTVFIDNHHLEIEIPEELLKTAGTYEIMVTNPPPDGGTSNTIVLKIENPVPSISALDLIEVMAGTEALTLNIHGTGFFDDTVFYVNDEPVQVNYDSYRKVTLNLTASDMEYGRYLEIKAYNPPLGGGFSSKTIFTVLNPVPSLSLLNPSQVEINTSVVLTLSGQGFVKTSQVKFNGQAFPITYLGQDAIKVNIDGSFISHAGTYEVKVINPAPGGGESSIVNLLVKNPLPQLTVISPHEVPANESAEITLTGSGFIPASEVEIDGSAVTTTFVDSNHLNAHIEGIFLIAGEHSIKVINPSPGGGISQQMVLMASGPISENPPIVTPESGYIDGYVYNARTGSPLSGIRITVQGIEGEIYTNSKGFFAFPVSDFPPGIPAREIILTAEKDGYTYGQRKVVVRSKLDVRVDDIYLVPRDSAVTTITQQGGIAVNSKGNIFVEFPEGAVDVPISVNITEFDASRELPAALPESSHFTFAADFLPDGVVFNKPVHSKIKNFLGFPPGTPVPVGYYDKDKGEWIPDGMGVISADGQWMEYDMKHFTPADYNWPVVCVGGCEGPPGGVSEIDDGENDTCTGPKVDCGASSIGVREGNLKIDHQLTGSAILGRDFNFGLSYNSKNAIPQVFISRTADYSGFNKTPDVIKAEIEFMGARKTGYFRTANAELSFRALFDPKNERGNELSTGIYPYVITLSTRYDTVYYALTTAFGGYPEGTIFSVPAREPKYVSKKFGGYLFVKNDKDISFGKGWGIDGLKKLILRGHDGKPIVINGDFYEVFGNNIITTVAGNGYGSYIEDGVPAIQTSLHAPHGVAVDNKGNIYIADTWAERIRKVDTNGIITTIAGKYYGYSGDGGPATQAKLCRPYGVAVDSKGNIYIADNYNYRIRKVDTNGIITTIAGTGQYGYSGDGGPATQAKIASPFGVAVDKAGNIYISDTGNLRIRKVDTNGIITTIAGNGQAGFSGDGGPATQAKLYVVYGSVVIDSAGNIYIPDTGNNRVRKINTSGIISTIAGNGQAGYGGDGGPATQASFHRPNGVAVDDEGNIFISVGNDNRIRKVDAAGNITTIAGTGQQGFSGDGGPAKEATLRYPHGIAVDAAGNIYIADMANYRIRKITLPYSLLEEGKSLKSNKNNGNALIKNSDDTYTLRYKDGNTVIFNPEGLQIAEADRNGNTTQYIYDPDGKLIQVIDPAEGITALNYTNGYLSSIADPQGRMTTFNIDSNGDLVSIRDPDSSVTAYTYDSSHRLTSKTLPGGRTYTYTYDSHGMVTDITIPDGSTKHYKHSTSVGLLNDIVSSETNPAPPVLTSNLYDEVIDELGNKTTYRTNRYGSADEEIDALGRTTAYERDKNNRPVKITEPDGSSIQMTYDVKGNLLTKTDAMGKTTTYTYEPNFNQVSSIKDPKGNITAFSYDTKGNLTGITDPLGNKTIMAYDSGGLLTSVIDANGNMTGFEYDSKGNPVSVTDPLGNRTSYTYDSFGNVISVTDAEGNVTGIDYDVMNRMIKAIDANAGVTRYSYGGCSSCGSAGLLTSLTDAKGNVTAFEYDSMGRVIRETNPLGYVTEYSYDRGGKLISKTKPDGNIISYTYNAAGRLLRKDAPDDIVSNSYDAMDNLVAISDSDSSLSMTYDLNGRLLSVTTGGIQPQVTISYAYDANGNRTAMTGSLGTNSYTYDSLNRLTSLNASGKAATFAYDSTGRRTKTTLPNGATAVYTYDVGNRLLSLTNKIGINTISGYNYTYDKVGNRMSMVDTTGTHSYAYDAIYQLIKAVHPTISTEEFGYDALGNRLNTTVDRGNRLLEDVLGNTYTYDANGNMTSAANNCGTTAYIWDSGDRLVGINGFKPDCTPLTASFKYDALGRRIEKTINSKTIQYLYDGLDIIQEIENGMVTANYIRTLNIDEPLARIKLDGTVRYYHQDALGSVVALTDDKGVIKTQYTYDPYGNTTLIGEQSDNPFQYTGRENDGTGLYYYRARYYSPELQRFISEDPIGFAGGDVNFYVRVGNNPVNWRDPLGLAPLSYEEISKLVVANNLSGQGNELIICIIWKESGFDPNAKNPSSSATGLMQVTKAAAKDAGYEHSKMTDPATNIQAGSKYLKLRIQWANGSVINGLNGYGTGSGYSNSILECEKCLKGNACDNKKCLK